MDALIEKAPHSKKAVKVYYSLLEANVDGDVHSARQVETNFKPQVPWQ